MARSKNVRRIVGDPVRIRNLIHQNVKDSLLQKFPIEGREITAQISNLVIKDQSLSHTEQRKLILGKGTFNNSVNCTLTIVDTKTKKKILTIPKHRLMNIPYYSSRFTFIIDGNEYAIVSQLRTKSGVYTRARGNDELESSFNLASGANFKLALDPASGIFKVSILNSTITLAVVIKILGGTDATLQAALGTELYQTNIKGATPVQMTRAINILYEKLVRYRTDASEDVSPTDKILGIRNYFSEKTKLDAETTTITLGKAHTVVTVDTILAGAKKILQIYKGEAEEDNRDDLDFQSVYAVEDIVKEILVKSTREVNKIVTKLNNFKLSNNLADDTKRIKAILSPLYFSKPLKQFIVTSNIKRIPEQINPLEIMDTSAIVTRLGTGAIKDEQSVPDSTRAVQYSYMGVIDPVATPESSKVGIDGRFSINAFKDENNELYRQLIHMKTGKKITKRVIATRNKYVGFPDPIHDKAKRKQSDMVPAVYRGKLVRVKRSQLDYQINSPHELNTVTTNSIPFLNSAQGNRLVMGAKHVQQALPLKERDKRLVQSTLDSAGISTIAKLVGDFMLPKSPVAGTVKRITDQHVEIIGEDKQLYKVDYENNYPLTKKTLLHNDISVKKGDTVKKGELLGDSNFTKDGELALGRNLRVMYQPWEGLNHEDGVVVTESCAKKMTSIHADRVTVVTDKTKILNKAKYTAFFPTEFTPEQLSALDSSGIIKKGAIVNEGDPLILVLGDNAESKANQVFGRLHKSLISPYRDESEVYTSTVPGEVLEVHQSGKTITVLLKMEKPLKLGDKLSGSVGGKGVTTKIIPDDEAPYGEDGKPIDIILTRAGVPGRINPSQILESALGKVADKTGKRYGVENYSQDDYVKYVRDELKKHGIKDKETVTDPVTGKKIKDVFVGVQHIHKLQKTTETNFSGRGVEGAHDMDETPVGSGETGPKALGGMEVNTLLAHNTRNFLRESTMIRGSKNYDFWKNFQQGTLADVPVEKKTFTKFTNILRQAGVKVEKKNNEISIGPLTDADVLAESAGEIKEAKRLDAKLQPETNGLFDVSKTGGLNGTKWSHIKLVEPVINPIFEKCVSSILGLSTKELNKQYREEGGTALRKRLEKLNIPALIKQTTTNLTNPKLSGRLLNNEVSKLKYLETLRDRKLSAGSAYMLRHVPVTPPIVRPITVGKTGDLAENDSNLLYKDLVLQNNSFKDIKKYKLTEDYEANRTELANRVREIVGTIAPISPHMRNKDVKGALQFIAGTQPKEGFFQRKLIYNKMNLAGRATIAPDTTLGLDEVGMPEDMAWSMYKPFILRGLVQRGHEMTLAKELIEDRSDIAKKILMEEMRTRPAVLNRAPTLWRNGIMGVNPVLRSGKNINVNPLWESAFNMDYDGDAMAMHLPISAEAIKDVRKIMPSKLVLSDKKRNDLLIAPSMEVPTALYKVTLNLSKPRTGKVHKYKKTSDAWKDYYNGTLQADSLVKIG